MSLNRATIIGHLGADSELRNLPSGQPVVNFTVTTDETFLDKQGQKQERSSGIMLWLSRGSPRPARNT